MIFPTNWYYSSSIPVRDRAKVDPWIRRRFLPASHHHRSTAGLGGKQFNPQPE